jgi:hypothetical protein
MPSLSSAPWIFGVPYSGFSILILRIGSRTSLPIRARPRRGRDFHRQYAAKPIRFQRTDSGLTMVTASRMWRTATIEPNEQGSRPNTAWCGLLQLMRQYQDFSFRRREQSHSMQTKRKAIAIMRRSCSDSLLTASQMDGVFGIDRGKRSHAGGSAAPYLARAKSGAGLGPTKKCKSFLLAVQWPAVLPQT